MRKKMFFGMLLAVVVMTASAQAETIFIPQHINNADFDEPFVPWTPGIVIGDYELKANYGTDHSWTGGNYMYWAKQASRPAHSGDTFVYVEKAEAGSFFVQQPVGVALAAGNTYEFTCQTRAQGIYGPEFNAPTMGVIVNIGGALTEVALVDISTLTTSTWVEQVISFVWTGDNAEAGAWNIGIGVANATRHVSFELDTIASPDNTIHAWAPNPGDGQNNVGQEAVLTWNAPTRVADVTYDVYLVKGDNDPNSAPPALGASVAPGIDVTSYNPDPDLDTQSEYYWRVDVHGMVEDPNDVNDPNYDPNNPVYNTPIDVTGFLWVFNTAGQASNPVPTDMAIEVHPSAILDWDGLVGYKHDVYFGTDPVAVAAADINTAGIYQGRQDAAVTMFDPYDTGWMEWSTPYYWRVDEVDESTEPDTIIPGSVVWSFTTILPQCPTPPTGDTNGDCVITLEDLANMADDWLECALVPQEACP